MLVFIFDHLWSAVMQFLCMEIFKILNEAEMAWTISCMCDGTTAALICVSVAHTGSIIWEEPYLALELLCSSISMTVTSLFKQ